MSMYDNGLQDPELREYHGEVKLSINLFLPDMQRSVNNRWQFFLL